MADEQFKGISLHPEDAMMNIEALVNASLFMSMIKERQTMMEILTLASDYMTAARKNQNGGEVMMNITSSKEAALEPRQRNQSQTNTNACGAIKLIGEKTNTFVYRFACVLKEKPERPPVIVLSTAYTESEAKANLSRSFDDKMRLIWDGRIPRKTNGVRYA